MGKQKFYVVWDGVTPGIYTSWTECQLQVKGYDSAKYKSFDNREEAERAFAASPYAYIGKNAKKKTTGPSTEMLPAAVIENSLAVDAACSGPDGVSWCPRGKPARNFSFRPDERYQQYRRVSGTRTRSCFAEAERVRHANL